MTNLRELEVKWRKRPGFQKAFDALEDEFARIDLFIGARAAAGLTQAQLARRMKITTAMIVRFEGGRVVPSLRTLHKLAAATGHKLKISLEPATLRGRA